MNRSISIYDMIEEQKGLRNTYYFVIYICVFMGNSSSFFYTLVQIIDTQEAFWYVFILLNSGYRDRLIPMCFDYYCSQHDINSTH